MSQEETDSNGEDKERLASEYLYALVRYLSILHIHPISHSPLLLQKSYCSSIIINRIESDDDLSEWQNHEEDEEYRNVNVNLILRLM
jgi:hypothetical protein